MADFKFEPMRSLIYVDCACEDYRPKLQRWLYKTHVPDSISQFEPYVTKYAFYPSFPMPEGGDRYGYARMQLTEHHWLVSDLDPRLEIAELTDREVKRPGGGRALLFERTGTDFPVLTNMMGSERRMALALGVTRLDELAERLSSLFVKLLSLKVIVLAVLLSTSSAN